MITDVDSFYLHDFEITVDIVKQNEIINSPKGDQTKAPSFLELLGLDSSFFSGTFDLPTPSMPTNPLNTDGIDPAGSNITITRVNITNFDDAIAVKPSSGRFVVAKDGCT
jgi:hypothetical protein